MSKVRLGFYDQASTKTEFTDFSNVSEMEIFYKDNYIPFDNCRVGDLVSIELFLGESDVYDFVTEYRAEDITGNFRLTSGSSFDIQRKSQRNNLTKRQIGFINKAVENYRKYWNEIYRIYTTGIYSPCYAIPGWSEGTWYLNELKKAFTSRNDIDKFPYDEANIINEPPE